MCPTPLPPHTTSRTPCALCSGLYPLQFLVNQFVKTPVTSLVALVNANGVSLDGWFALSGNVQLQNLALT